MQNLQHKLSQTAVFARRFAREAAERAAEITGGRKSARITYLFYTHLRIIGKHCGSSADTKPVFILNGCCPGLLFKQPVQIRDAHVRYLRKCFSGNRRGEITADIICGKPYSFIGHGYGGICHAAEQLFAQAIKSAHGGQRLVRAVCIDVLKFRHGVGGGAYFLQIIASFGKNAAVRRSIKKQRNPIYIRSAPPF